MPLTVFFYFPDNSLHATLGGGRKYISKKKKLFIAVPKALNSFKI